MNAEQWRDALAAFYRHDAMPAKALRIQQGAEFDSLDLRAIEALQAAFATKEQRIAA
jgi:hypothetical protein